MRRYIYETLHPEIYHGYGKKRPFFEGWYFKLIDVTEQERYAIIPGIFRGLNPDEDHAFVQVLDGMQGTAVYHRYPVEAFRAHEEIFDVWVGPNHFTEDCIDLDIDGEEQRIKGRVYFENRVRWPVTLNAPGIMGWYAWVPFMECYHGVVSMDHGLTGTLEIDGKRIDFDRGLGYIEKDWGQAFPSGYVWQQSNHFDQPGTSLTASIALIPFLGRVFPGFLVGFWHHGKLHRMTTYTGAEIDSLNITDTQVQWVVSDRNYRISMISTRGSGGLLHAPIRTEMHERVDETMQSTIAVQFAYKTGSVIYEGTGRNAALEVHGEIERLLTG